MLQKISLRLSIFGMALGIAFGTAFLSLAQAQTHAVQTVIMKSISYDPKILQIKVGDSVEWQNKSYTQHSATADDGSTFDTGLTDPNKKTKKVSFDKAGTYSYHCSVHGKTMSGQIVVTP